MKAPVTAKANEFKFPTWRHAEECIEKDKKYGVKCTSQFNMGLLNNTYELCIEGTEKNINNFLNFLEMKGFKIKRF